MASKGVKRGGKAEKNPIMESSVTYHLDLKQPIDDKIIDIDEVTNHFKQSLLKLAGKRRHVKKVGKAATKKTEAKVDVSGKDSKVHIQTNVIFSKRLVKYLAKKYLKKQDMRDYLRVVATDKHSYAVKYCNISESAPADK